MCVIWMYMMLLNFDFDSRTLFVSKFLWSKLLICFDCQSKVMNRLIKIYKIEGFLLQKCMELKVELTDYHTVFV